MHGDPPPGAPWQGTPGCQAEWAPVLHRASPGKVLKQDSPPHPSTDNLLCRLNWRGERGAMSGIRWGRACREARRKPGQEDVWERGGGHLAKTGKPGD